MSWKKSRSANTALRMETPKAPPMVRKNVAVDVATPELRVWYRVLDGHDQDLHDQADAQPGDDM